ncbi:type II toxin-antitoxin system death-on-curing family toxin [Helicobacter sp. NHP21005]|uniref:type II toxin-antitoxin system death-on-curing family toxin n=1 Tax=Helicobacter felistomachi TaxID=3040201 RepID=UPI0025740091|nr:type II toxin-antitoxin system death-on-curing family toxin [Helicobacter sp. NHP21005]BEG57325.1 type II toxin-antitoxin system death-on-curing family toxin [Helicobacter sp. NHP21005]
MFYLALEEAIILHDEILGLTQGLKGYSVERVGYLGSALENIQNDTYYPTLEDKCAHLMFACIKFHPFADGNKRSAIYLAVHFLEANGVDTTNFEKDFEDLVVFVAAGNTNKAQLSAHICPYTKHKT